MACASVSPATHGTCGCLHRANNRHARRLGGGLRLLLLQRRVLSRQKSILLASAAPLTC